MINIIVAYSKKNRVIGANGTIPWHISEDFKRFKLVTTGHVVVLGSNTWESLPIKPLPGRFHIVITLQPEIYNNFQHDDVIFVSSPEIALFKALGLDKEVFVIGGGSIYRYFLNANVVDRVFASEIKKEYDGDITFPPLEGDWWDSEVLEQHKDFDVVEYRKKWPQK